MSGVEGPGFKDVSTGKKVATAAGVAAGVAAAASLAYAVKKGQVPDTFEGGAAKKVAVKIGDGYKQLGAKIVEIATAGKNKVVEAFTTAKDAVKAKFAKGAEKVAEKAEEIV